METMNRNLITGLAITLTGLLSASAYAAPTFYNNRITFSNQLATSVTDDYSKPGYVGIHNNAAMSAVLGETDYTSTGHLNWNLVFGATYCAGCNGSFQLDFTSTSVGNASGVFGVGMDVLSNAGYHAFITYGDNSTLDIAVPGRSGFFGITAPELITSIHFGLANRGTTTGGYFQIDNLTIGSAGQSVPEPTTLLLASLALVGVGASRKRALV